jgi:tRNA (guanosine-2'-O-)-methyltransferase
MRAANRESLPQDVTKDSKFPRTSRREQRLEYVLDRRQPDLTVILENVHDPHNISAVLRTCDAVGILRIHTIYTVEVLPERAYSRRASGGTRKWVDVIHHDSVDSCFTAVRADGLRILATALSERAVDLYQTDLAAPVALLFGNEQRGASEESLEQADGHLVIPMQGMVESLNISVACAVTLFEAQRQRIAAGLYDTPRIDNSARAAILEDWLTR